MSNKSKTFILAYMAEYIEIKFLEQLIDTYILYNGAFHFCMKYEFDGKKEFTDYEYSLTKNKLYVEMVDINSREVLYIFDFPEEMYTILELFQDGKYSQLPNKGKIKRFLTKHFKIPTTHRIYHILDKTEYLRKAMEESLGVEIPEDLDLEDPPNLEDELITFEKTTNEKINEDYE